MTPAFFLNGQFNLQTLVDWLSTSERILNAWISINFARILLMYTALITHQFTVVIQMERKRDHFY